MFRREKAEEKGRKKKWFTGNLRVREAKIQLGYVVWVRKGNEKRVQRNSIIYYSQR